MHRIAVLISDQGSGTNLQALIDASVRRFDGQLVVAVSAKSGAYGLKRAEMADVPTIVHDLAEYRRSGRCRTTYEEDLVRLLQAYKPDFIVLAGWVLALTDAFMRYFPWRVVAVHPGLLPEAGETAARLPGGVRADACLGLAGRTAIQSVLASGERYAGASVYALDAGGGYGPTLARGVVPVYQRDSIDRLYVRLKRKEHELLVDVMTALCEESSATRPVGVAPARQA